MIVVCKLRQKWAFALFSTFFFLLTACGKPAAGPVDQAAEALGREAQSLSLGWLESAAHEASTNEVRQAIEDVQNILAASNIASPPSAYSETCNDSKGRFTAAFVTKAASDIYVCSASKRLGKVFLAQVLIHEALHLGGITDECEVTRLEIEIMTSAMRIPYKNAYVTQCGLD